jgi:hypothetical protein
VRILVGKTFGIGNAVMSVPMIRALRSMGHRVDVLCGSGPDDGGALNVFKLLRERDMIWADLVDAGVEYDVAIMSIPFDGRWREGIHFQAKRVFDGRTRPDPSTTGLVSWQRHEVEYQMDTARALGYTGPTPSARFFESHPILGEDAIYFGVGYKKDAAGFWRKKHWGNERFAELAARLLATDPTLKIYVTGDANDLVHSIGPIRQICRDPRLIYVPTPSLYQAFDVAADCGVYFGNDTGMMHVAAAQGRRCVGIFNLENSVTKNGPWCNDHGTGCGCHRALEGWRDPVTVDHAFETIMEVRGR